MHISAHCVHLQDDFKITKKIATGGFGTVYRAECDDGKTPGGRPVIIKKASCSVIPLRVYPQAVTASPQCRSALLLSPDLSDLTFQV